MKIHEGVYDTNPETATEFPHGPVIEMDDGKCIYFDLHMEQEASICFAALHTVMPDKNYAGTSTAPANIRRPRRIRRQRFNG